MPPLAKTDLGATRIPQEIGVQSPSIPPTRVQDKKEKVQDVGQGLELKGNLDNSLGMSYDAPNAKDGAPEKVAHQVFLVNFVKGKTYLIEHTPAQDAAMRPYLFVEDAKKKVLAEKNAGAKNSARLFFRPPADGVYRIIATTDSGLGEGDFTVKIAETKERERKEAKPSAVGEGLELKATLDDVPYATPTAKFGAKEKFSHQLFLVNFVKGKTYWIEQIPAKDARMIPYLLLEDANKEVLAETDDGNKSIARLLFRATEDAVYRIIATTLTAGGEGDFTVKVRETGRKVKKEEKPRDVGKGFERKVRLDNSDDNPYWAPDTKGGDKEKSTHQVILVNFVKGKTYQIEMIRGSDKDWGPYLYLEDSKMKVLAQAADRNFVASIVFTAPTDGVYRIIATTFRDRGQGDFTLRVVETK